jgi:predicted small secreted protein
VKCCPPFIRSCGGDASCQGAFDVKTRTAPQSAAFLLMIALAAAVAFSLAGCNTISGAGQDVANTGHAISHTANTIENHL